MLAWSFVLVLVGLLAYFSTRMTRRADESSLGDTGLAIVEFGRAFPNEAIRSLHATEDGKAVFVRLHDNKAGFMRNMRNHFACHLITPGRVRVRGSNDGYSLTIDFLDASYHNGDYSFASAAEAAEVSLWLLGNYVAPVDRQVPDGLPGI
ncbi:hypothetical protein FAA97_04015 [Peteryoungia ipomoeae]|uniref:Uncharacterized protein n=2 Tax=Peteryoungia ipomoeae TaxID=1210932 RepID=A0A4S8P8V4_9HYPH|nr:hypothetical protein [Peteryoungia ipomoeae]THV25372.1 hypothetical protein FAA97_04015 [Peteryoungia ipomoeae]